MPYIKFIYEDLDPEILKKAKQELGETDEIKAKGLDELKKLIKGEPDFHPCTDDIFLLRFLRFRKFDVEKAFIALKNYYNFKANYSGTITDFIPSDLENILNEGYTIVLEHRGFENECVAYQRSGLIDVKYDDDQHLAVGVMISEIGLTTELTQFAGYSFIFDMKGLSLRQSIRYGGYSSLYKMYSLFKNGSPCRAKAVHIVNQPPHVNVIVNIVRTVFLTEKLRKRLHIHGSNMESLHKFISPDILPEELGGKQGPASECAAKFKRLAFSMEDYFSKMKKFGYKKSN